MNLPGTVFKKIKLLFLINLLLGLMLAVSFFLVAIFEKEESVVSGIEEEIRNGSRELHSQYELVRKFLGRGDPIQFFDQAEWIDFSKTENLFVLISKNDSLVYWNSNSVVLPNFKKTSSDGLDTIVHTNNGYYQVLYNSYKEYNIYLLLPVFSDYSFENSSLENSFSQRFGITASKYIIADGLTNGLAIHDQSGRALFSIIEKTEGAVPGFENFLLIFLLIIWYISFNHLLFNIITSNIGVNHTAIRILIQIIAIYIFRVLLHFVLKFSGITVIDLLNSQTSGFGFLFPNLFDFILNSVSLYFVAIVFSKSTRSDFKQVSGKQLYLKLFFYIVFLIILIFFFVLCIEQIIYHSSVSLLFSTLYDLESISYLIFILLSLISISFFIIITRISGSLLSFPLASWKFGIALLLGAIAITIVFGVLYFRSWIIVIACFSYLFLLFLYQNKITFQHKIVFSLWSVALFAILVSVVYNQVNKNKADANQTLTAYKLGLEKDPLFEFLFSEISERLQTDSLVKEFLKPHKEESDFDDEKLRNYLNDKYFGDYFEYFSLGVTVCLPNEKLSVQPENFVVGCAEFFDAIIRNSGKPTEVSGLFYIDDNVQGSYYISRIQLSPGTSENETSLILEFYNKFVPEGLGYPELLVDERKGISSEFSTYSFANYRDNVLVYKFGDFLFPARLSDFSNKKSEFFESAGYKHYIYPIDSQKTLIVSRPLPSLQENLAPLSMFVILLLILSFITYVFFFIRRKELSQAFNFRLKLQLFIFSALMISFAVFGIVSVAYIRGVYKQKNMDFLTERTQSILIELQQKMQNENLSNEDSREYLQQLLLKFSLIFFSDINLYATDGQLIGSSRPEIFTSGLMSGYMNQTAYYQMRHRRTMYYLQQEHIGKGTYYSSYIPLRDVNGNPIAYLNLPYFARESELRKEISGFVFAYLNIFLALTAVSVAFALVLSRRLTKPMQMIQERMKSVRIGKVNQKILWKGNDELGQLVSQYNQLIDDLETSAGLLARSERESAWREMARQVAHEIKNPLTPMRLSVQYLQKAWDEGDPNIDDKLHRTTKTLVDQIDTLSEIASAFSDFAKMPDNQPEKTELSALLFNAVLLFNIEAGDRIRFVNHQQSPCYVFADPKNLSRAFNNLIKNAIQATIHKEDGFVEVILKQQENVFLVVVRDNGIGIPYEEKEKIFLPNFTTKSSGMGIGLSIVHHIISLADGSISFETEEGTGTSFSVRIPLINRS